jgi:HYR domain
MSVKGMIAAVSAALTVAAGATVAVTLPAHAETPECGQSCVELFSDAFGAGFLIDSNKQAQATGTPIILFAASNADPAEDFTIAGQGLVSAFYANGLVSAAVDQHYGGDAAYEVQYSPYGAPTGQCVGVAATATAGEKVTLQPCSASSKTIWIADSAASVTHSFVPLINGSDTNFSNPFVLTYPAGSNPEDLPRPQLEVDNLPGGQVPGNQLWTALGDILGGVLSIAQPANITTDATGPSGATVTYPLPAVTDPDASSPPAAVCTPPSGSVFPIGTTTVTCTATDSNDINSPASISFTITVEGAAAQLADLYQAVHGVGSGNSLASIVAIAQQQLSAGHPGQACLTLSGFIIEVKTQIPLIPSATAAQLITDAARIQAVLGCGSQPAL